MTTRLLAFSSVEAGPLSHIISIRMISHTNHCGPHTHYWEWDCSVASEAHEPFFSTFDYYYTEYLFIIIIIFLPKFLARYYCSSLLLPQASPAA